MTDGPPDPNDDTGVRPTADRPSTPRWVKVSGIIVAILVLLFVVMMLTGVFGGEHGPGRQAPSGNAGTPPASVPEGHTPPIGAHTQA